MSSTSSRSTAARSRTILLVAGITLLGAVLRLWDLGGQSLWLDEVFTARIAPLGLSGIIDAIRSDLDTPPLHPFLVHAILFMGSEEFVLRLPSAVASILCVPLIYVLAQRLLGRTTALLAALLIALSPFAVYFAQEARMYSLVLLFSLLAWYTLTRALAAGVTGAGQSARWRDGAGPWWIGFIAAGALGLYAHFFGFALLGMLALYAAFQLVEQWRAGDGAGVRRNVLYLFLALIGVGVLYLPWLPVLFSFVRENYSAQPYGQGWQANLTPRVALNMLSLLLGGYWAHPAVRWLTRFLFVVGLLFLARRRPSLAVFVVVSTLLPFAVIGVLNPGHFVTERYFIFMLPMLILSMAEALGGLAALATTLLRRLFGAGAGTADRNAYGAAVALPLLGALLVIPLLSASGLQLYFAEPPKPAWRQLAHYVASHVPPGDLVVVVTFPHWDREPLQHYLHMGGRRVAFAAEEPNLRHILTAEERSPWWIVYAGTERRLGRLMSTGVGNGFSVVPFDFLALLRHNGEKADGVGDGLAVLRSLAPRIPGPYQGEAARVIKGLESSGDMGKPIPSPMPKR